MNKLKPVSDKGVLPGICIKEKGVIDADGEEKKRHLSLQRQSTVV